MSRVRGRRPSADKNGNASNGLQLAEIAATAEDSSVEQASHVGQGNMPQERLAIVKAAWDAWVSAAAVGARDAGQKRNAYARLAGLIK